MARLPVTIIFDGNRIYARKGKKIGDQFIPSEYYGNIEFEFVERTAKSGYTFYQYDLKSMDRKYIEEDRQWFYCTTKHLFDDYLVYFWDEKTTHAMGFRTNNDIQAMVENIPFDFKCSVQPFSHQIYGAKYILMHEKAFLFWETGTGKTLTALLAFDYLRRQGTAKNLLVVCPNSLVPNWVDKIKQYFPNYIDDMTITVDDAVYIIRIDVLTIKQRFEVLKQAQNRQNIVIVTNYDTFSRLDRETREKKENVLHYDFVIFDESHFLKNGSNRTVNIKNLVKAEREVFLTGTPSDGKFLDYYNQYAVSGVGEPFWVHSLNEFKYTYTTTNYYSRRVKYQHVFKMLKYINQHSYELKKEECLDLPEKIYTRINIELTKEHMDEYERFLTELTLDEMDIEAQVEDIKRKMEQAVSESDTETIEALLLQLRALMQRSGKNYVSTILPQLLYARMIVSGVFYSGTNAKIEWLKENLHDNEKYVIYAMFRHTIGRIVETLREEGFLVEALYGDIDKEKRNEIVQRFNNNGDVNIIVAQPSVGGMGIDLVAAHTCIFYENDYSYITRKQAEDRLHRIGQKNAVEYIDLIAKGTIDETMYELIMNKKELVDAVSAVRNVEQLKNLLRGKQNENNGR